MFISAYKMVYKNFLYLYTGYVGSPSFLREVQHLAEELKQLSPNLVFGEKSRCTNL